MILQYCVKVILSRHWGAQKPPYAIPAMSYFVKQAASRAPHLANSGIAVSQGHSSYLSLPSPLCWTIMFPHINGQRLMKQNNIYIWYDIYNVSIFVKWEEEDSKCSHTCSKSFPAVLKSINKQCNGKTKRLARPPIKLRSLALEKPCSILTNRAGISLTDNGLSRQLHMGSVNRTEGRFVSQSVLYRNKSKCSHFYLIIGFSDK